jgi:hypothetical protein
MIKDKLNALNGPLLEHLYLNFKKHPIYSRNVMLLKIYQPIPTTMMVECILNALLLNIESCFKAKVKYVKCQCLTICFLKNSKKI